MDKKEEAPLDLVIVRSLIIDIYGRMGLEQKFKSISPGQLASLYEEWQERVSIELHHKGKIDKPYKAKDLRNLSDYEAQEYLYNKFVCDYDDYR